TGYRAGTQQRYVPPNTEPRLARTAIIISPLLPRTDRLPSPAQLIAQTLDAEAEVNQVTIEERGVATELITDSGLEGVSVSARVRGRTGVERRIYVLVADARFFYGVSYLAAEDVFADHEAAFWAVARSIRPFDKPVDPTPFAHYGD